jgi:hypothetical protein
MQRKPSSIQPERKQINQPINTHKHFHGNILNSNDENTILKQRTNQAERPALSCCCILESNGVWLWATVQSLCFDSLLSSTALQQFENQNSAGQHLHERKNLRVLNSTQPWPCARDATSFAASRVVSAFVSIENEQSIQFTQ